MEFLLLPLILVLIAIGVPIGYALIGAGIVIIALTTSTPLVVVAQRLFNGSDSFPMVAVPWNPLDQNSMGNGDRRPDRIVLQNRSVIKGFRCICAKEITHRAVLRYVAFR